MSIVSQRARAMQMNELVVAACRLVGTDDGVRGVHIVAPGRPAYDDLCRYQETARANRVRLAVGGTGHITIRPMQYQGVAAGPCHADAREEVVGWALEKSSPV